METSLPPPSESTDDPAAPADAALPAPAEGVAPPAPPPSPLAWWKRALLAISPVILSLLYLVGFVFVQSTVAKLLFRTGGMTGVSRLFQPSGPPRAEFFLLVDAVATLPILLLTFVFLKLFHRRTLASLGLRWPPGRGTALREAWQIPAATLAFLLLWVAALVALPLHASFHYGGVSPEAAGLPGAPLATIGLLALLLVAFLVQGGLEEWMLRGYVYQACKERWTVWGAIAASSLLFAALHAGNPGASWISFVNTLLIGVILALMVEASGSLWGATLAHGVWNFTVACLLSLPVSGLNIFHLVQVAPAGPPGVTGGLYGPEASGIVTAIAVAAIALLLPPVLRRQRSAITS